VYDYSGGNNLLLVREVPGYTGGVNKREKSTKNKR